MKRKIAIMAILALALVFVGASFAQAQQAQSTAGLTVNATVSEFAALTLAGNTGAGAATITFPNSDPGANPTVTARPVTVSASFRTNGTATVYVLPTGAGLVGSAHSSNVIPWSNISSTSSGAGFFAPSQGVAWGVGSGSGILVGTGTQSGVYADSFTYTLLNSYNYNVDSYSGTVTYTLLAP